MWGYFWGFTDAQIELMVADCPITVYATKDEKGKKKFQKASAYDVEEKAREWTEKYGTGENGIKIDLKGFSWKK